MNELDIANTIMFVREVCKAKDGDTKMIFGKPFKMSGGKWVPSSGGGKKEEPKKEGTPKSDKKTETPKKEFKESPVLAKLHEPNKYEMDWERGLPKPIDRKHLNKPGVVDEMVGALENYGISTKGMNDDKAILQSYNDMIKDIRHDALFKKNKE